MLILKPRNQLTADDIRSLCHQFDEGIRVEYKQDFGPSVREKLPKVVSSFANSYGGLLIIGVRTDKGRPIDPIEGFEKPGREELPLTVENICHQNIYPLLTPQITEVPSDIAGKVFLIIEVEPSLEAPFAIENSRKVYVRTGNASDPYDLADLDLLERLIKRRDGALRDRHKFETDADTYLCRFCPQAAFPKVRVTAGPRYPHSKITDREQLFLFLRDTRFRSGHFYKIDELRRLPNGASGTRGQESFGYLDTFGQVFHQEVVRCGSKGSQPGYLISELIHPILQTIYCASRLYKSVGFLGDVSVEAKAIDLLGQACFIDRDFRSITLQPSVETLPAEYVTSSELFEEQVHDISTALVHQLVWPMSVGFDSVTEALVRSIVEPILREYRA